MSAIAWTAIKAALHAWVVAASGLPAGKVFFAFPGANGKAAPRPQPPCIELHIDDTLGRGTDWKVTKDAADPQPGAELEVHFQGHRTARLELQCFYGEGTGDAARVTLETVVSALPLHYYELDLAGAGIGTTERVQLVGANRGGILEPRAITGVQLHLGSDVVGYQSYVERMQVVATATSDAGAELENELWVPDPPP